MEKGKAIFVTALITAMLAAIDGCLYVLNTSSFTVLTGAFVVYGVFRWALDFYRWLGKPAAEPTQRKKDPAGIEAVEQENRETGKKVRSPNHANRDGAKMSASNEKV